MITAKQSGNISCHMCSLVSKGQKVCPRCDTPLHSRIPQSLQKSWSLLIGSILFYFPANLLPIMQTTFLGNVSQHTIMGGVIELWDSQSYPIALVVFCASIIVPVLKMIILFYLLISVMIKSKTRLREKMRLYRFIEFIGRWSMIDVFVVAILSALVQISPFMVIAPGSATLCFAMVVILTILATRSFDPRLLWDHQKLEKEKQTS